MNFLTFKELEYFRFYQLLFIKDLNIFGILRYVISFILLHDFCNISYSPLYRLCGEVVRVPGYRFRGPGSNWRRYQIIWEVVGLDRDPSSLVSTIEKLHGRKSSGSGLEIREYGRGDSSRWPHGSFHPQKLALTSPTNGGRSVGIVRSRTKATEFSFFIMQSP
jgi:hypothetical protein